MKRFNIKFNRRVISVMNKIDTDNIHDGVFDIDFNFDYISSAYTACNHRDSVVFLSAAVIPENFKDIGNI